MNFVWPQLLWLLLMVPALIALYLFLLARKKKSALKFASLTMVKEAMSSGHRFRRHVPALLFLLAFAALLVGIARPMALVTLPSQEQTVVLAIDVSGSMGATDVKPTRMVAAQEAAKAFVADQPRSTRIGIVSFAGTAAVVQPPTESRQDINAAIDRFTLQRATAIGSGIIVSLATLFPESAAELSSLIYGRANERRSPRLSVEPKDKPQATPVPPGSYSSAAIILLTDGQATMGPNPIEAAKLAADRGVRVYTVGVGTADGEIIHFEGWTMRVRLDEETLKTIADMTRGEYFNAGSAAELKSVYETLNARLVLEQKETEITALFAGVAALLALLSAMLSLLWFNRIL